MPVVLNKTQCDWRELEGAVLIDRTTPYGNPFIVGPNTRDDALRLYAEWIVNPLAAGLRKKIRRELRDKNLVCHCAPLDCHGDVILIIANARSMSVALRQIRRRYGVAA